MLQFQSNRVFPNVKTRLLFVRNVYIIVHKTIFYKLDVMQKGDFYKIALFLFLYLFYFSFAISTLTGTALTCFILKEKAEEAKRLLRYTEYSTASSLSSVSKYVGEGFKKIPSPNSNAFIVL